MRCVVCNGLSIQIICKHCCKSFLQPQKFSTYHKSLQIYYFYNYDDIAPLLKTKHTAIGYKIFHFLAKYTFRDFNIPYTILPIDYYAHSGYNHSAIIAKYLGNNVKYAKIKAKNRLHYSKMGLKERLQFPRNFEIKKGVEDKYIVLVDDIYTTGTTLFEAKQTLKKQKNQTLFALTLAH